MAKKQKQVTMRKLIFHLFASGGTVIVVFAIYFYYFLPYQTNKGVTISVPNLIDKDQQEIERILKPLSLRYEVSDSSYSSEKPVLVALQQVPIAGVKVKPNHKIFVTLNRRIPPSVPLPNLFGEGRSGSLVNATAVLKSADLIRGDVIYTRHQNRDLIIDILYNGKSIEPGTLVPKKSIIDLVVGDGVRDGVSHFIMPNYVGMPYKNVLIRLENFGLRLGDVKITDDVDTTGIVTYVLQQAPEAGDSIWVGDPVKLWIGLKDYDSF